MPTDNPYVKYGRLMQVAKGMPVCNFISEEQANRMYILLEGRCSLSLFSENGKEKVLLYFNQGDFINYVPLLKADRGDDLTQPSYFSGISTYAKTDCTLVRISQSSYEKLKDDATFQAAMFDNVFSHYQKLLALQRIKANKSATAIVSSFILFFSECDDEGTSYLDSFFTFAEIAKAVELHPVSVGRIVGALRKQGAVQRRGRDLVVIDPCKLSSFADETLSLCY
ncbi:MAG: Crp/Fnr family transcriptional regulator [Eggerthellaceae bacterium]|nr:Crp/Fnr family transcriptional regulator [Eggerthellaceae bacterium]